MDTLIVQVTWSEHAPREARDRAAELAKSLGIGLVSRRSFDRSRPALVVTRAGLRVRWGDRELRWHEGMIHALRSAGDEHPWVRLSNMGQGDRVVDCTLGLGTDARFLAERTGVTVRGFEVDPVVAALTGEGLAGVGADVEVVVGDATAGLAALPDGDADVVIADPMFPSERVGASHHALELLRLLGRAGGFDHAWLAEASRVARRAVVVKDVRGGALLETLGAPSIHGRKDRVARFGVWRLDARR